MAMDGSRQILVHFLWTGIVRRILNKSRQWWHSSKEGVGARPVVLQLVVTVKKAGVHCGPGCKCLRYSNLPVSYNLDMLNVEVEEMNDGVSDSDDDNLEEDVNNIIYEVFGSDDEMDSNTSDIEPIIRISDRDIDEEFM